MAFVNEWISQEDIEKYGLIALTDRYREDYRYMYVKDPRSKVHWVVDREREIWLIKVATLTDPHFGDFPKSTDQDIFILYHQGVHVEITLKYVSLSNSNKERPFLIGWEYMDMQSMNKEQEIDEKKIKKILQEALIRYKGAGLGSELTDVTAVKFKNF